MTVNKRELYILVLVLCAIGISLFLYKALYLKFPVLPKTQEITWNVEVRVHFDAEGGPVKVYLQIPESSPAFAVDDEQFISRGYGMSTRKKEGNRVAVWSLREAKDEQTLYYRATIRPGAGVVNAVSKTPEAQTVDLIDAQRHAAENILAEVQKRSADTETLVTELVKYLNKPPVKGDDDSLRLLLGNKPTIIQKLDVAVSILGLAKIPARVVHGVRLQSAIRTAEKIHLLQVYYHSNWITHHPVTGILYEATDYLTWWHGNVPLLSVKGGHNATAQISVSENQVPAISVASWRRDISKPLLSHFSLLGLPLDTQAVYKILLMVPVGVFMLVILRNLVGIKTFGTFMPVLIAMAFRETQLLWGIVLFCMVVGLGLAVRFYLDHLRLLLVPRLAAVLVVVITLMAFISVISNKMGLYGGLSVALFPMVILTMTIERMSIVWEERGAYEALQQGSGSLLVAALAYLLMQVSLLQHLVFIFPELLLVLLAFILLLGRYSGYRLLELRRFKVLARRSE